MSATDSARSGKGSSNENPLRELQRSAYELLIAEAKHALAEKDDDRFKTVMDQIALQLEAGAVASSSDDVVYERQREKKMDAARLALAGVLLAGLIAIVVVCVTVKSTEAATYVSLVSGLAGIALGWVFGANTVQTVGRSADGRARDPGTGSTGRRGGRRDSAVGAS